jgi:hypothetical protein
MTNAPAKSRPLTKKGSILKVSTVVEARMSHVTNTRPRLEGISMLK